MLLGVDASVVTPNYVSVTKCLPYCVSQVTIIIYLSVVGALLLYMLFLLLVDPLIRKHDPYTQPLHNEEDSEVYIQTNTYSTCMNFYFS